jgi:hypothetical protein
MLGSPGTLGSLLKELLAGNMANGALGRSNFTFMNITANRADPLLHNNFLHDFKIFVFVVFLFFRLPLGKQC